MRLFRVLALISLFTRSLLAPVPALAQDSRIDVSGRKGADGQDGRDGSNGSYGWGGLYGGGGDGGNGTNAGPAEDGEDAGEIHIRLERVKDAAPGNVRLRGSARQGGRGGTRTIDGAVDLGSRGNITLRAAGGGGGKGGTAGDGGRGGNGRDGSDASRYSSADNGGNGGDGGDGGIGTSGGAAGDGGVITVRVDEKDTDLLKLLGAPDVSGGAGGQAGSHGRGGSAGSGGRGGSSYTWYEEDCTGYGDNRSCTQTSHYKSGGSDGWSGKRGRDGSGSLSNGRNGRTGRIVLEVTTPQEVRTYTSVYDIRIEGFDLESEVKDGIIEPGERVTIKNIRVRNVGGMPTPAYHPIRFNVPDSHWVRWDAAPIHSEKPIAPGQSILLPAELSFRVPDTEMKRMLSRPRFQRQDTTSPYGVQTGVERSYAGSERPTTFTVTYPLELSAVRVKKNLAPGETSAIEWDVKNISTRAYAGSAKGEPSDVVRSMATTLALKMDESTPGQAEFHDADGNVVELEKGYENKLARLAPGATVTLRASIRVKPDAESYSKVAVRSNLTLGRLAGASPADKAAPKLLQLQDATINVAEVYRGARSDSDVLLVTNYDTTTEEIKAWKKVVRDLGLKADVWDLSYQGHLDLARKLGSDPSLREAYANKTIVLLNNTLGEKTDGQQTDSGKKRRPTGVTRAQEALAREQLLEAGAKAGTRFYLAGGHPTQAKDDLARLMIPTVGNAKAAKFASISKFVDAMKSKNPPGKGAGPGEIAEIEVTNRWKSPDPKDFNEEAKELREKLEEQYPGERFLVVYDYDPRKTKDGLIWDTHSVGKLRVFRSLRNADSAITQMPGRENDLRSERTITGADNQLGVLLALPMERKVRILAEVSIATRDSALRDPILKAILSDVAGEQVALRNKYERECMAPSPENFDGKLPVLEKLLAEVKARKTELRWDQSLVPELLAKIRVLAEENDTFFGSVDGDISNRMNELIVETLDAVYDRKVTRVFGSRLWTSFESEADELRLKNALATYEQKIKDATQAKFTLAGAHRPLGEKIVRNSGICGSETVYAGAYQGQATYERKLQQERVTIEEAAKGGTAVGRAEIP